MEFRNQTALMKVGPHAVVKYEALAETIVAPAADIYETTESFVVKLDMPGVLKEAIHVTAKPDQLLIKASIDIQERVKSNLLFSEIGKKVYRREFNLGSGVDYVAIRAEYLDGVLTLVIPKNDSLKTHIITIS